MKLFVKEKKSSCFLILSLLFLLISCGKENNDLNLQKKVVEEQLLKSESFFDSNLDSALVYSQKAALGAKKKRFQKLELKAVHLTAKVLLEQNNFKEALRNFKKALNLPIIKKESVIAAEIYKDIGLCEIQLNNHLSAILNYRKCLNFKNKIEAPEIFADASESLGDMYRRLRYNHNALNFYSESQNYYKQYDELNSFYIVQNKIGDIYQSENKHSKALELYKQSLEYFSENGNKDQEAFTLIRLAELHMLQQTWADAKENSLRAKEIAFEVSNFDVLMVAHFVLGQINLKQENYKEARREYLESYELANILSDEESKISITGRLAVVEEKLGNYKQSIAFYKEYHNEIDEILGFQEDQKVKDLLTTITINKNQKEIASLQRRNSVIEKYSSLRSEGLGSNRSFIILLTAFVIVFILLVAVYYKRFKDKKNISKILEDTVKERTDALNETLQKLSFHVNNTSLAVIELDVAQKVKTWSARSEKIFGWSSSEVLEKELFAINIFQDESLKEIINAFEKIKKGKIARKFKLLKNLNKEGGLLFIEWNFSVLSDDHGKIISILCFANDVTHRELALIEAETANKELDNFIYKTSHDVKGPIARIEGLINLGLIEAKEQVSIDYFKRLNNVAATFNIVLSRLFRIHGLYYHKPEPVVLNLKSEITDLLHSLQKKNNLYDLKYEIDMPDEISCKTDKLLLYIIIQNIYENALDYRKDGLSQIVFLAEVVNGSNLKMQIRDNGTCIPLEAVDRIFDMFFQNTAQSSTAGLGLYMVKKSVEKLGGTIKLLENKSETIFEIVLPKASA